MQNKNASEMQRVGHVKLFSVLEISNGTVSIFNIESCLPDGDFYFEEFPGKIFNSQSDRDNIIELLEHYRNGGIKAAEQYLQTL